MGYGSPVAPGCSIMQSMADWIFQEGSESVSADKERSTSHEPEHKGYSVCRHPNLLMSLHAVCLISGSNQSKSGVIEGSCKEQCNETKLAQGGEETWHSSAVRR